MSTFLNYHSPHFTDPILVKPQLSRLQKDSSTWWMFKKESEDVVEKVMFCVTRSVLVIIVKPQPEAYPVPISTVRPVAHPQIVKNRVAITIPAGWLTTISAVLNLVFQPHFMS